MASPLAVCSSTSKFVTKHIYISVIESSIKGVGGLMNCHILQRETETEREGVKIVSAIFVTLYIYIT